MIISRTPFRISFFGGGTDYPVYYKDNPGAVLSTTINKYCYISVRYLPPFFEHKSRIAYSKVETVEDTDEIDHPSVRECLNFMDVDRGVEVHHDGDLPARAGMGTSSAFTVGMLNALHGLKGEIASKRQLAEEALHVEQDIIEENVGSQDQVAAAHGGLNRIKFHDETFEVQTLVVPPERKEQLQDHLMLFFTGFSRTASEVAEKQIEKTPNLDKPLTRMYELVDEAMDVLQSDDDIAEFGKLLHETWTIKRNLTDKITNEKIDRIYKRARGAGAIGGKLLGAGAGGFMCFFVRPEDQDAVREELSDLLHVPFGFEDEGSKIIYYDPEQFERVGT